MLVRRRPAALAAVVTLLLTLGACSSTGGDDADVTTDGTSTTVAATTEATTSTEPDDASTTEPTDDPSGDPSGEEAAAQAKAESVNLVAGDFPSGWQAEPDTDDAEGALELCSSIDLDTHLLAKARSDNFSLDQDGGQLQISSTTGVLDAPEAAADILDEFRDDDFVGCASDSLNEDGADGEGYTLEGSLARNDSEPDLADGAVALSGDYVLTPADGSTPSHLGVIVVAIHGDDTVAIVTAIAIDTPGDETLLRDLLDTVAERLAA